VKVGAQSGAKYRKKIVSCPSSPLFWLYKHN